jgi:hypothetical protein
MGPRFGSAHTQGKIEINEISYLALQTIDSGFWYLPTGVEIVRSSEACLQPL